METLYVIGVFGRLTGLTPKALRRYDAMGLLAPAEVDPATGYRRYSPAQIARGRTIRRLRHLGVPLENISAILDRPEEAAKRLADYRRNVEAETFRGQRILHRLDMIIGGEEPSMADHDTTTELTPEEERQIAVDLFNHVWELLENPHRTPAQDDRMLHAAHASRFHWDNVGEPVNLAVGEWQCGRVYAVLGRGEPAVHHARRSLAICEDAGLEGFTRGAAFEGLARAFAVAGDRDEAARCRAEAERISASLSDPEERALLEGDLATLPS